MDDAILIHQEIIRQSRGTKIREMFFCSVVTRAKGHAPTWVSRAIVTCTPSRGLLSWFCHTHGGTSHCEHIDKAKIAFPDWVQESPPTLERELTLLASFCINLKH